MPSKIWGETKQSKNEFHYREFKQFAPKARNLRRVLIENAPQALSKEELMNQVRNDSFVKEANLTHYISALRKALGEDKTGRKFIETIPRKDLCRTENSEKIVR